MKRFFPIYLITLVILCSLGFSFSSDKYPSLVSTHTEPPAEEDKRIEDAWVDSVYLSLTTDQRIGQLFMIRAHSDLGDDHIASVKSQIKKYHVGGLCFFQGTPEKQAKLTNEYQALSKTLPLLVAVDGEWGLGMRFKTKAMNFPKNMALGAIQDNSLIYHMGMEIAYQMKRIGIHVNFAPVVDINNNANNPVINTRSFGESRKEVAIKSYMYMLGIQDGGAIACAKHFPGHGDTDMDSHYDLPIIHHSRSRLDSLELFPFRLLAQNGVKSVMTAHLQIPALEPDGKTPSSLSAKTIQGILIGEMGFDGLIFTDGLEMEGIHKNFDIGEIEVRALEVGNDILLLPRNIEVAFEAIRYAIKTGRLSNEIIELKVKKIIRAKYQLNLHNEKPINLINITADLHSDKAKALNAKLISHSFTLLKNKDQLIPFVNIIDQKYASLSIGTKSVTAFQRNLEDFVPIKHYKANKVITSHARQSLIDGLSKYDRIIVSFNNLSSYASKNFGIDTSAINLLKDLQKAHEVVIVWHGNPYGLKYFDDLNHILVAFEGNKEIAKLSAEAIFGVFPIDGKLPVTASDQFRFGDGENAHSLRRMGYAHPAEVDLNPDSLKMIDKIVSKMIKTKAAPGCQILVAKDRKIVYNKSFGYHTYDKKQKVKSSDLYDLASITKVAASTLAVMKLVDEGLVDIHTPIKKYLPELSNTNKAHMTLYDIMSHHAGLAPWIPFYKCTLDDSKNPVCLDSVYSEKITEGFSIQIADKMYMRNDYVDTVMINLIDSDLRSNTNYRYSDLGYYLIAELIDRITGSKLDKYVANNFYIPLGLKRIGYNPLKKITKKNIIPTEKDTYWRQQTVHGHVHDMGAAMLGGVAGHAGLFSNAEDLAVVFQMLLNDGYYGGHQFLRPETISLFTQRHNRSQRRGIGFDMKQLDTLRILNISEFASDLTYGHLGFTGTCVWADPETQMIFIFLSNRTYPNMNNNKLGRKNYRPNIQSAVYRSLEKNYGLTQ